MLVHNLYVFSNAIRIIYPEINTFFLSNNNNNFITTINEKKNNKEENKEHNSSSIFVNVVDLTGKR